MFEDLAQSAIAVFLFTLAGFCLTWLLSPLTTTWELARLRLSPRSIDDRLSEQSLVGPVIILGSAGFIISGIVGWSVGMLMQDFDPINFTESSRHINVTLASLAVFAIAAYLTNAYARFGSGKPTNLGEKLYELQRQERGLYAPEHMDEQHWRILRESITSIWDHKNTIDKALLIRLVGAPLPDEPWNQVKQEDVLSWRKFHSESRHPKEDKALARGLWRYRPAHWFRVGILSVLAMAMVLLAIDSLDASVMTMAALSISLAAAVVPPLVLRATRSANRGRTAVLARDLLWTQRALHLIDAQLAAFSTPIQNHQATEPR